MTDFFLALLLAVIGGTIITLTIMANRAWYKLPRSERERLEREMDDIP